MKKKLTILIFALALLAATQMGLLGPASAAADSCETFCGEFEGCVCCSTCCVLRGREVCTQSPCACPPGS